MALKQGSSPLLYTVGAPGGSHLSRGRTAGEIDNRSLLAWSRTYGPGGITASCQAILKFTLWRNKDSCWAELKGGGSTLGTMGLIGSCHLQGNSQDLCKQLHSWRVEVGGDQEAEPGALHPGVEKAWPLRKCCLSSSQGAREPLPKKK